MDTSENSQKQNDSELVSILMRQTTYTKEEAIKQLKDMNNNLEKCIEVFLEIKPKLEPEMSVNQKIFKNIRDNM